MLLDKATNDDDLVDVLRKELQSMRSDLHTTKQLLEREKTGRQGFGEGPRTMVLTLSITLSLYFHISSL